MPHNLLTWAFLKAVSPERFAISPISRGNSGIRAEQSLQMTRMVNIIAAFGNAESLERQNPGFAHYDFTYSQQPVPADFHVYLGAPKPWPTQEVMRSSGVILLEPPEIEKYPVEQLSCFQFVLAPNFRYLSGLPNHRPGLALLPWRIGLDFEIGNSAPALTLSAGDIRREALPKAPLLTAVVSGKTRTKAQKARLELVKYFQQHLGNFRVYGRDSYPIPDKADAHRAGIFHLAVENSRHAGYSTEKLIDPILMGNHVFYWGDPAGVTTFGRESVTPINLWRPRSALKSVVRVMSRFDPANYKEIALNNRERILTTLNFHAQLVTAIAEVAGERGGPKSTRTR